MNNNQNITELKGWEFVNRCPLCGFEKAIPEARIASTSTVMPWMDIEAEMAVVVNYKLCLSCGLKFQSPRLMDEGREQYYSSGLYRRMVDTTVEAMDNGEMDRAERIVGLLQNLKVPASSHLDMGCSRGYFLNRMNVQRRVGCDLNPSYREDLSLLVMTPAELADSDEQFELVTALHVLEHVPHPVEWLKEAVRHLRPGGMFVVEVPFRTSAFGFAHLLAFDPRSLMTAVGMAGIRPSVILAEPHLLLIGRRA